MLDSETTSSIPERRVSVGEELGSEKKRAQKEFLERLQNSGAFREWLGREGKEGKARSEFRDLEELLENTKQGYAEVMRERQATGKSRESLRLRAKKGVNVAKQGERLIENTFANAESGFEESLKWIRISMGDQ